MKKSLAILLILFTLYSCKNHSAVDYCNAGEKKMHEKSDVGDDALNKAKYKVAVLDFDTAINLDNKYVKAYALRALAKSALGDHDGAMADAEKITSLHPDSASSYIFVANIRQNDFKDFEGAIKAYDQAIKLQSDIPSIYALRGHAEKQTKDYAAAIKDYDHAISICPTGNSLMPYLYSGRGQVKVDMNDKSGACLDFSKAVSLGYTGAQQLIDDNCK
ncbi:tetratricopeptide repeat protein [Mucilaginibacter gotjawali]|uniref:Tetratricopeptide (TPR) repeat protein n=1 Tax=Mucilaginibacter gotjawali TaxID=1550579 RepID=A0A839SJ02_9SPHI|nr:tetratricopeptide repeat protein [Mucilaginibacter gotjawali]MBB3057254.1 tetratricopeptide (TPR) repeat protein [Mucilaginibacter gotjawali]